MRSTAILVVLALLAALCGCVNTGFPEPEKPVDKSDPQVTGFNAFSDIGIVPGSVAGLWRVYQTVPGATVGVMAQVAFIPAIRTMPAHWTGTSAARRCRTSSPRRSISVPTAPAFPRPGRIAAALARATNSPAGPATPSQRSCLPRRLRRSAAPAAGVNR